MGIADFDISASGPEDVGYDATAGEVLTLQLTNLPTTAYRTQFSVERFSKDMPSLVFSPVSGEPATPGGTVTVTCPGSGIHSFIIDCVVDNGVDAQGVTRADYRSSRCVVIRSAGTGLAKIVPAERTEYDTTNGWTGRINEMIDATDVLATATSDPTPNTLALRNGSGAFGVLGLWIGADPSSAGQLRCSDGFALTCNDGSDNDVTLLKCTTGAIEVGDTTRAASVSLFAKSNGSISATVMGTGTAGLTAVGASSKISLITNSQEVLHAEAGSVTMTRVLGVTAPPVPSGGGIGLPITAGDVSGGGGIAGDLQLTAGKNLGGGAGTTGAIVLTVPLAAGNTGNIDLHDGSTQFLRINASTTQASAIADRNLRVRGDTTLLLEGGTTTSVELLSGTSIAFTVNSTEIARFNTTALHFPNTQNALIDVEAAGSGTGKDVTVNAGNVSAGGGAGGTLNLIAGVNAGGATGSIVNKLTLAGGVTGNWDLHDGSTQFLRVSATSATTTAATTRALTVQASDLLTLTGGTEGILLKADSNTIVTVGDDDVTAGYPLRLLKQLNLQWKEITYAATITPNLADGMIQYVRLTGDVSINLPTFAGAPAENDQGIYVFLLHQDGTGNRLATWAGTSDYQFVTDTGTLSTAAHALDVFVFVALPTKANTPTMLCILAKKGFTTDN